MARVCSLSRVGTVGKFAGGFCGILVVSDVGGDLRARLVTPALRPVGLTPFLALAEVDTTSYQGERLPQ